MTRFITLISRILPGRTLLGGASAQAGKSVTIADANVIAEADLAKLPHMNAAIAKALVGKRPFLGMTALDMFLQSQGLSRMQLNELYGRLFLHINLNTASDAEIQLIPNLGPRMLREFKEYALRKPCGVPSRDRQVCRRCGAGAARAVRVRPDQPEHGQRCRHPHIPGLGARMLREFKEYRPYKQIEQFRREIGKYVSKEEVARFERYVTIK